MSANKPMQMTMISLGLLLLSAPASANVLIPFMLAGWLTMVFALIPVIIVEALVLALKYGISAWDATLLSGSANIVSTVAGIPLAMIFASCLQSRWIKNKSFAGFAQRFNTRTRQVFAAICVVPFCYITEDIERTSADERILSWVEPTSLFVVLGFFFLCSWAVEGWVAGYTKLPFGSTPYQAMFYTNVVSYVCLAIVYAKICFEAYGRSTYERPELAEADKVKMLPQISRRGLDTNVDVKRRAA